MTLSEFEALCRRAGVKAVRIWIHPFGDDDPAKPFVDVIATIDPDTMCATYGAKTMADGLRTVAAEIERVRR